MCIRLLGLLGDYGECFIVHLFPLELTNGPDDSLLQLPLLVSFYDLGTNVGAAIIATGQLIVDAETELPQQRVEHLQHCRTCRNSDQWLQELISIFKPGNSGFASHSSWQDSLCWELVSYPQIHWLLWQLPRAEPPRYQLALWLSSYCWRPGDREAAGLPSENAGTAKVEEMNRMGSWHHHAFIGTHSHFNKSFIYTNVNTHLDGVHDDFEATHCKGLPFP